LRGDRLRRNLKRTACNLFPLYIMLCPDISCKTLNSILCDTYTCYTVLMLCYTSCSYQSVSIILTVNKKPFQNWYVYFTSTLNAHSIVTMVLRPRGSARLFNVTKLFFWGKPKMQNDHFRTGSVMLQF